MSHYTMPSRTLYIAQLARDTRASEVLKLLEKYGEVAKYTDKIDTKGIFFATYYDQREADAALKVLDGLPVHGRGLVVRYAVPRPGEEEDEYDLSVFATLLGTANATISVNELRDLVEGWGVAVKKIRAPWKANYKFIDCYDVRHAEMLKRDKNGTPWRGAVLRFKGSERGRGRKRSRERSREGEESPPPPSRRPEPARVSFVPEEPRAWWPPPPPPPPNRMPFCDAVSVS